jgi:predicted DCC family thiol-disulfide oxidoreductase YuxK
VVTRGFAQIDATRLHLSAMSLRTHLRRAYLSVDPRSLGLFRILFAAVLLLDLYWRALDLDHFYTNAGLLPNHTVLWAPRAPRMFSLFFTASTRAEAIAGMSLCAAVFAALLVGWRTRLMQVLALICLISLNTRIAQLENGGDIVLNLLATWTVFLPLGRRFSLDALLASLRDRQEQAAAQLADRAALRAPGGPVVSLAALALVLQLFVIYLLNSLHKAGPTWLDGTAVHYTLHQDRLVSAFGVWLRENASPDLLALLTWATLGVEAVAAVLVISPIWPQRTRLLAIALLPMLHLGFALCLDLGPFSYAMAIFFALLITEEHWDALGRWLSARGPRLALFFDASCGICFQCARIVARLDPLGRIRLLPNDDAATLPAGVTPELVTQTIVVQDLATGRLTTRSDAVAELLRALPFGLGLLPRAVLLMPGLRAIFLWLYDLVARNRIAISAWFGLAACGIPRPQAALEFDDAPATGPARLRARARVVLRETTVAIVLLASVGEVVNVNASVPLWMRYRQPDALHAIIEYGRLIQSWRMFAPDAPLMDYMVSVEAITADGRLVDPYNEVASRYRKPPFTHIPTRLGNDQFFTTYSLLIPSGGGRPFWPVFEQWILAYPSRTGNPRDRIVRFTAYVLSDHSPAPGARRPHDASKVAFLTYPSPK